jgi:putative tricarboxylic transport membrane protein
MSVTRPVLAALGAAAALAVMAAPAVPAPEKTECIVGAKPGGGFDLTCRLLGTALQNAKLIDKPMAYTYMEGGVGATAMNHIVGTRPGDPTAVVAASTGSALLLAQKKFGAHDEGAVRWVGALGAEFGSVAVATDSPYKTLKDLVEAIKAKPDDFSVAGGGAVGSQDWMKAALIFKAAGQDPKKMRYIALEGGGPVVTNVQGGHVKIGSSDIAEFLPHHKAGKVRVLAVMAPSRLPGEASNIATAKEQGYDILWTVWRGVYVGPKVSDADYKWWVDTVEKVSKTPEFKKEQEARGLYAFPSYGKAFADHVKADVARFKVLAADAGLIK